MSNSAHIPRSVKPRSSEHSRSISCCQEYSWEKSKSLLEMCQRYNGHHSALRWGGVGIGAVVVVTSIIAALLFLIPPALSLSGGTTVTSGGMLHLHGSSFTPGNSVSLTLDNGLPLSPAVHKASEEAQY